MIKVDSLLYKIDQRLNKLASNDHQEIQLEDKILALNEAQIKLIKLKVTGSRDMGLDSFKKRYEDLENLIIPYNRYPLNLVLKNTELNEWVADIDKLDERFMFYIDSYFIASKGVCKNRRININKDLAKHGDIVLLLQNEHYKPSFEYQESFNQITDNKFTIYTDGTFIPSKVYISYLKYPLYIDKEGYIKFDGTASDNQDCELEDYLEDELLDLTVQNLGMYTENQSAVQTAQNRIQTNE
jgi:hypothetical protein